MTELSVAGEGDEGCAGVAHEKQCTGTFVPLQGKREALALFLLVSCVVWFAVEHLDSDITEGAELNDVSDDGLEGLAGRLEVSD